jgi:hypothetical protein
MARPSIDYSNPGRDLHAGGFDPDTPVAGYYRIRLRRGAVWSPVRIWHGPPNDPVTGEEMDRGWRWQATVNGELVDLERVWPGCADNTITEAEHDHLIRLQQWSQDHDPAGPFANPNRKIDLIHAPLPF